MARPLWSGTISFGLVNIPVSLAAAEENQKTVHFSWLDRHDHAPVGYQKINKNTGEVLKKDDIVKAYEYDKGEFVLFTDEEIKNLRVKGGQSIDISQFVDMKEIDWRLFEKPYVLMPDKKAGKTYGLLREVLKRSKKVGVARLVLHSKAHLAMVAVMGDALVLETMRFPHELRSLGEFQFPEANPKKLGISEKEIQLGLGLVEQMAEAWKPEAFEDTYYDEVMELVEEKAERGGAARVTGSPRGATEKSANIVKLLPLLEASLSKKRKTTKRATGARRHAS